MIWIVCLEGVWGCPKFWCKCSCDLSIVICHPLSSLGGPDCSGKAFGLSHNAWPSLRCLRSLSGEEFWSPSSSLGVYAASGCGTLILSAPVSFCLTRECSRVICEVCIMYQALWKQCDLTISPLSSSQMRLLEQPQKLPMQHGKSLRSKCSTCIWCVFCQEASMIFYVYCHDNVNKDLQASICIN